MSDNIRLTFQRSLNKLMNKHGLTQKELASKLNVSNTTINNWVLGYNVPRMDKIDQLAKLFNVTRTDLIGTVSDDNNYYIDPDTRDIADEIHKNKELSLLFDAARDASPEDLQTVYTMLKALKDKERGNDN